MSLKPIVKQLVKHRDRIAKERDALRNILEEFEDIATISDEAIESLDAAIQKLSEQL